MARWIFVRHGQSVANVERWLSGHVDTPLTPLGREQARAAGQELQDVPLARAFTSDLVRAHDTARLVLHGREVPLEVTTALRERFLGDWASQRIDALRASGEMSVMLGWETGPPGGESQAMLARRVLRWLATVDEVEGHTLIVAHGGVIRVLLGLIDGVPLHDIGKNRIANARPNVRDLEPGTWTELVASHG